MADVEIYTQPWCPFCERAVALLQRKGVSFREIHAPQGSAERAESVRRAGGVTSVPQIFIDGELIGGSDALLALDRGKKLDVMLGLA